MMRRSLVILTCIFIILSACPEAGAEIFFKRFLPDREVRCNIIDDHNRLWVGTNHGFSIINNGYVRDFEIFDAETERDVATAVSIIMPCAKDALIATSTAIYKFNIESEEFHALRYEGKDIVIDAGIVTGNVAYFYSSLTSSLFSYTFAENSIKLLIRFPENLQYRFKSIEPITNSHYLAMADANLGVFAYSTSNGSFRHLDMIPNSIIPLSLATNANPPTMWIADNEGVSCYNSKDMDNIREIARFDFKDGKISSTRINDIATNGTKAYVATDGYGVNILDSNSGLYEIMEGSITRTLKNLSILNESREDVTIIGGTSYNGLIYGRSSFATMFSSTSISASHTLSSSTITASMIDKDGAIWFGTDMAGVNYINENSGITRSYSDPALGNISSMASFGDNYVICVNREKDLLMLDKNTGRVQPFTGVEGFSGDEVYSNIRVHDGGDGSILFLNANEENIKYSIENGICERFIVGTREEPETILGVLSFPHHTLFKTEHSIYEMTNSSLMVRRIFHDPDQSLVRFTSDGDDLIYFNTADHLYLCSRRNESWEEFGNNSQDISAEGLCIDKIGNIWMISEDNILASIDTQTKETHYYPEIGSIKYSGFFAITSENGTLYFSCTSGVMKIEPESHSFSQLFKVTPRPSVESILVDGNAVEITYGQAIKFPHSCKRITANLLVRDEDPLSAIPMSISIYKGSYLLRRDLSTEPLISTSNLSPGNYSLRVSLLTPNGWSAEETMLKVKIKNPFYLSAWALIIYLLFLAALFNVIYYLYKKKRENMIERAVIETDRKKSDEKIDLMANLAHDIRSPLSLVLNRINSVIDARPDDEKVVKSLSATLPQINRMTEMVNMILDIHKQSSTDEGVHLEDMNLNAWIVEKLNYEYLPKCKEKGMSLRFIPDKRILNVSMDKEKLRACLQNLVTNAIKYSEKGTITVSTAIVNNYIRLSVKDQGRGFDCPTEDLFKKFYRQDQHSSVSGYGLGLAYVKSLVDKLGGDVWAFNNPEGVGATFYVDLPLTNRENSATAIERERNVIYDTREDTILIVDDQKDIRDYLAGEYKNLFKKVFTASDGLEAIPIISERHPNLIISDLMMPNMGGFDLCKYVKTHMEISHIPFVLFSTKEDAIGQKISYKLGPDDVISKPFDMKLLGDIVKAQLKKAKELKASFTEGDCMILTREMLISKADEDFIIRVNQLAKDHWTVSNMAETFTIPMKDFNAKIEALTGISAEDYCKRAEQAPV